MKARLAVIAVAIAMLVLAGVAWWLHEYERVTIDVAGERLGEARYNPYFGLKKALQEEGLEVEAHAGLALDAMKLAPGDLLVFGADVRTLTAAQSEALLDWVETGGELVIGLPSSDEGRAGDLLDALGVRPTSNHACYAWNADGKDPARACFGMAFHLDDEAAEGFEHLLGDADGHALGRFAYGDGHVTLAADLDPLGNVRLGEKGMAAFAWQVVGPALVGGKVHIVYAADVPPWHVLLVRYGWPALLPALLALLAWLWSRGQRLGPLIPLEGTPRRALGEHIAAAGEFAFRRGRAFALYAPVRRRFDQRLQRNDPALAALDGEALVIALAQRSGRSPAEIRLAIAPKQLAQPEHFLAAIKILSELEASP